MDSIDLVKEEENQKEYVTNIKNNVDLMQTILVMLFAKEGILIDEKNVEDISKEVGFNVPMNTYDPDDDAKSVNFELLMYTAMAIAIEAKDEYVNELNEAWVSYRNKAEALIDKYNEEASIMVNEALSTVEKIKGLTKVYQADAATVVKGMIAESKLTQKEIDAIPEEEFGLPDRKAFPMPDEKRVKAAIAYFHTAKETEKKELAKNIKRRIKELELKIELNADIKKYL
jgi:hypothetical protein